ncbi:MAG: hypothetical protein HY885_16680 [Deltaproteobacteria bacterium]|nr:hypothetical protein [Deltaproteobacteria bacterium]
MTLVVAYKSKEEVYICGDTRLRLLDREGRSVDALNGSLKVIILSESLCFAYAGNITHKFADSLPYLCNSFAGKGIESVLSALLDIHILYNGRIDFIVSALSPTAELIKIQDLKIIRNLTSAWIGDIDAFNVYQESRLGDKNHTINDSICMRSKLYIYKVPDHPEADQELFLSMCRAMESVVGNERVESVGDFYTAVSSSNKGFYYLSYASVDAPCQPPHIGCRTIGFGSAQEGGCSLTALTPSSPGSAAVAFHYFQGQLGILFLPKVSYFPLVFAETNCCDFIDHVKSRYGVCLDGPRFG